MSIKLKGTTAGSAVILAAPADTSPTGTEKTFTLPTQDGEAGQILKTDGSGALSFTDNLSSGRNLIINGDMRVAQRATSVTGVANSANEGYQSIDRFGLYWANAAGGACTVSQSTDVPSNQGFSNSYKIDVTTADTSLNANHFIYTSTKLEAREIRTSGWNYTDPSSYLTLSFWVKSTKAGTYCSTLRSYDTPGAYHYVFEYTLAASTWTKVTHKIPGHASLVFDDNSEQGLDIRWNFANGSDRDDHTGNAWLDNGNGAATANQVNFFDSTDNDFYLTGVQLEVGEVATAFERRSYVEELIRCQRYFYKITGNTSDQVSLGLGYCYKGNNTDEHVRLTIFFPVTMRTGPSYSSNGIRALIVSSTEIGSNSSSSLDESIYSCGIDVGFTSSSLATYNAIQLRLHNTTDSHLSFSAEL